MSVHNQGVITSPSLNTSTHWYHVLSGRLPQSLVPCPFWGYLSLWSHVLSVRWQVTYDLPLLETSKVYSGFLNDGVLLLNVWFSQLQVRMVNVLSGTSKRVCLTTIHVLFSSSHTQFLLYVSLIAQLYIYISKCPCPCHWPCGFCGRTYKISCKSQICV